MYNYNSILKRIFACIALFLTLSVTMNAQSVDITDLTRQADAGDAKAQYKLGKYYYDSNNVEKDGTKAFKYALMSANQRNAAGENLLGSCYCNGIGVVKNYSKAVAWYQKAADQGLDKAQYNLGCCYREGTGILQSDINAYNWYKKAADQGNKAAIDMCNDAFFLAKVNKAKLSIFDPSKPPIINIAGNNIQFIDVNGNNTIDANEACKLRFRVNNTGLGDGVNCIAKISATGSTSGLDFSDVTLPTIPKGGSIDVEIPIKANMNTLTGNVNFKVNIYEPNGFGCDPIALAVNTRQFESPLLQVSDYSVTSDNGTSLNKRVPFDLQVLIQNIKHGEADEVNVSVELPQNVLLLNGQPNNFIGTLSGGATKSMVYSLIVNNNYTATTIPVKVNISEKYGKYADSKTINLQLNQTLAERKIVVNSNEEQNNEGEIKVAQISGKAKQSDVDVNIAENASNNSNTFAVIIANEKYRQEESVQFAQNDGNVFDKYCRKTLGIPETNIHFVANATLNDIRHEISWLDKLTDAYHGQAKVIFYYAGHGIPDESNNTSYLMPVDAFSSDITTCYKLSDLYDELGKMQSKLITVFLDACFSGASRNGGMLASARGVAIKAHNDSPTGNVIVFSAAQGDQTAYPYSAESHGLFTYFLLKELQKSGGKASLGDIANYVTDNVSRESIVINGKSQTPIITPSPSLSASWQSITLF